jgi:hypothetical protein
MIDRRVYSWYSRLRDKYPKQLSMLPAILDDHGRDEHLWLWEARSASHVFLVEHREHEKYAISDYNRACKAYRILGRSIEESEIKARSVALNRPAHGESIFPDDQKS